MIVAVIRYAHVKEIHVPQFLLPHVLHVRLSRPNLVNVVAKYHGAREKNVHMSHHQIAQNVKLWKLCQWVVVVINKFANQNFALLCNHLFVIRNAKIQSLQWTNVAVRLSPLAKKRHAQLKLRSLAIQFVRKKLLSVMTAYVHMENVSKNFVQSLSCLNVVPVRK